MKPVPSEEELCKLLEVAREQFTVRLQHYGIPFDAEEIPENVVNHCLLTTFQTIDMQAIMPKYIGEIDAIKGTLLEMENKKRDNSGTPVGFQAKADIMNLCKAEPWKRSLLYDPSMFNANEIAYYMEQYKFRVEIGKKK